MESHADTKHPATELGAACLSHNVPASMPAGEVRTCWLALQNRGSKAWRQAIEKVTVELDGARLLLVELPHSVAPGERVTLHWVFRTPSQIGRHVLKVELLEENEASLERRGVQPFEFEFQTSEQPITLTRRLRDRTFEIHARCWLPCDGMSWSNGGPGYPQFAREAAGCWTTDVQGRRYVDYLMGWGCALLGYGNERIQRAVAAELGSGATLTLTHQLMPEVGEMLCAMFPGAEAVTFGKNGSDVCSAAVRLARVYTGRPVVLFCGYHGWQDWYAERMGFSATGVPERSEPLLVPFQPNNLEQLVELLGVHSGRVAAVMLEPAGVIEGSSGPVQDVDIAFLKEMVVLAHREGALVVFDEIMTGFRYPGGSVQHATGIVPDLTCLGKALSAGMPLSALIGRRDLFDSAIGRIFYSPTFKGEVYSLAAAREALTIYGEQDVPACIWKLGNEIRTMIDQICEAAGVPAQVIGPPFRMLLAFSEEDGHRRTLMRTLVQQELLKRGVLTTNNLLLPSTAHDDRALAVTRLGFEHALAVLADAMEKDDFASYLEIPPLPP